MFVSVLLSAALFSDPVDLTTGTRLYHSCQEASRLFDSPEGSREQFHLDRVSECMAYIQGYIDGGALRLEPLFCPSGGTIGTGAKVYVRYMDQNPKLLDSPRSVGLLLALVDAYPCPKK